MKKLWKKIFDIGLRFYATVFMFGLVGFVIFLFISIWYPDSTFVKTAFDISVWTFAPGGLALIGFGIWNFFKFIKEDIWGM